MDRESEFDALAIREALIHLSRTLDSLRERLELRERTQSRDDDPEMPPSRRVVSILILEDEEAARPRALGGERGPPAARQPPLIPAAHVRLRNPTRAGVSRPADRLRMDRSVL
jgi:hypothetical protein